MVSGDQQSPLGVLGFGYAEQELYAVVLRNPGATLEDLAWMSGLQGGPLIEALSVLTERGLVRRDGDRVLPVSPENAIGRLFVGRQAELRASRDQLDEARRQLPDFIAANHHRPEPVESATIEVIRGRNILGLLPEIAASSPGPMAFLRPDQWRYEDTARSDLFVKALLAEGVSSRAIYPAQALEEAPGVVRARAEEGEQVRFLATVPTRLALFGSSVALLPYSYGVDAESVLVIRQEAIVAALQDLFEGLWDRALSMPGLERADEDSDRRLLLEQLATGAKDEQIARTLGISLRTVRRRVADVMAQLGTESRFQAGAEAVRRGWL